MQPKAVSVPHQGLPRAGATTAAVGVAFPGAAAMTTAPEAAAAAEAALAMAPRATGQHKLQDPLHVSLSLS